MKELTEGDFRMLQAIAKTAAASGYFADLKSEAQALMKLLIGHELGLTAAQSLMNINIVQGRPELGANIIATRIKQSGKYDYRVKRRDAQVCEIEFFENGEPVGTYAFTLDMARRAGLAERPIWKQYPEAMLFNRALSAGARMYCPDAAAGLPVYVEGEISESVTPAMPVVSDMLEAPAVAQLPEPSEATEDEQRSKLVKRIHALARELGFSQEEYRDFLSSLTGKASTKAMTIEELEYVVESLLATSSAREDAEQEG